MSCCVDATIVVKEKTFLQIKDHPLITGCGKISTYPNFTRDGETAVRIDWDWVNHWLDGGHENGKKLIAKVKKIAKNDDFAIAYVDEYGSDFCLVNGEEFDGFVRIRKVVEVNDWAERNKQDGYVPSGQLGAA